MHVLRVACYMRHACAACCVLRATCYVLHAVCCVLCAVCCVHAVCYMLRVHAACCMLLVLLAALLLHLLSCFTLYCFTLSYVTPPVDVSPVDLSPAALSPQDTPPLKRHKLIKDFQDGKRPGIFIVTYGTAAVGITLTAASRVYLMEPALDPATEAQAAGRIHRLGQTREVLIKRFCFRDSVEEVSYRYPCELRRPL